ncbi:MAG TPA: 2-C-methyl-D-erythritol 4-phosphate cytidylyltransferase [Dehalococcoidia bacterium]|nr:2-C-methyl-D-erythritol 4-phosphate cytidylyltransferase [Dehalococcoidia bacterium]
MTALNSAIDWQPVVVAAGASARFGRESKLLASLCGKPVLQWSFELMLSLQSRHPLVVAVSDETREPARAIAAELGESERVLLVDGGRRRRDSVEAAVTVCSGEYVAIHDAARPLATAALVRRVLAAAGTGIGTVPAEPVNDTLATIDAASQITAHPDRERLRSVQTPQCVRRSAWLRASATDAGDTTDDSSMIARLGLRCTVVEGEPENIKITHPNDLAMAHWIVRARGEACSE